MPGRLFLNYVTEHGYAPLDRQLYLTKEWAADEERREKCHVPGTIVFQEKWRISLDLLERSKDVPHRWVTADDEFGRVIAFRSELRFRRETYVLDVPCNTLVRDPGRRDDGGRPKFAHADTWAKRQPAKRWKTIRVRPGEKGPR